MYNLSIEPGQFTQIKQTQKLVARMKLANFMNLPEDKFACLVNGMENDPLFKKLIYPEDKKEKVISYQRFLHTDLNTNFYELNENITPDITSFDVVSFLEDRKEIIPMTKKLGIDKFKQYFLYNEGNYSNEEISLRCGLTISEVEKLNNFVNELAIHSEFFHPSRITSSEQICYTKIASLEKDNSGDFFIRYYSPNLARGRYVINYEKIARLKKEKVFSKEETKKLDKLLKKLELINLRKSTLNQILYYLLQTQTKYLKSDDWKKIKFLKQKDLASKMGVHPSVINRMLQYRSIETPWGEEKPLKYFFTGKKKEIQNLIRDILEEEKDELNKGIITYPYSDGKIKNKLKNEYKIALARRTVREYRKEIEIDSSFQRRIKK
jgi:hypothetical protein